MAKVTGPAFSLDARGPLGGGICFTRCMNGNRVILMPNHKDAATAAQLAQRASYTSAHSLWRALGAASKAYYDSLAESQHMSGYNLYMKKCLLGEISLVTWEYGEYNGQVDEYNGDTDTSFDSTMFGWTTYNWGNHVIGSEHPQVQKYGAGLRFKNVNIPPKATILTASIQMACQDNCSNTVKGRITGNADNDPAVFSTIGDYQARRGTSCGGPNNDRRTVAQVDWSLPASLPANVYITTPDLSPVIQELVDRAGYQSGKAMVLFVDDHDGQSAMGEFYRFYSWDDNPNYCAKLNITYKYVV